MKSKRTINRLYALAIWTTCLSAPVAVLAQWSSDPTVNNAITTIAGQDEYNPAIVNDGSGGAIISWNDPRNGSWDIYAQRINTNGYVQWTTNGIPICTAIGHQQFASAITSDGSAGAIVSWNDPRNGNFDIYAQHVNASGAAQWTTDGIPICISSETQEPPKIVSDGSGGAIITWRDYRNGTDYNIYAQRVNASGVVLWTTNGVPICTATGNQDWLEIINDGSGGAIITWGDYRSGTNYDIYAQCVNANGVIQWTTDGVSICTATYTQSLPKLVTDGSGGAIIVWQDQRGIQNWDDIYAQRVDASGTVLWTTDGVIICTASRRQVGQVIVNDGSGGAIIAWMDYRSGYSYDIYAQMVDINGAVQWTADGVALCTESNDQEIIETVSDSSGGAIIVWEDHRPDMFEAIYAQRVNTSGIAQWATNGAPITTHRSYKQAHAAIADGSGGVITTWMDYRNSQDIYAQRVNADGTLGFIVVSYSPTQNQLAVAKNTDIQVQFNLDVDPTTINSNTFVVHASQTGLHTGTYSYNSGTKTATLNPTNDFDVGERVILTLTAGIQTTTGISLSNPYEWSFTVEVDGGTGNFLSRLDYPTGIGGSSPIYVSSADFDNDGNMDLVAANYEYSVSSVSILQNNGDGTFKVAVDYGTGIYPCSIFSADFDRDNDIDLSVANEGSNTFSILMNNGDGTFQEKTDYVTNDKPSSIFSSDFNCNGYMDLAVTNLYSHNISVFLNNGDGTFLPKVDYETANSPQSVYAADVNADGYMDLAVANKGEDKVSILLNRGDGSFQNRMDYNIGYNPYSIFGTDLDSDGDIDLGVANMSGTNIISVMLNQGNGTFQVASDYGTKEFQTHTYSIFSADLDDDGDMDFSAVNMNSNLVSILKNNSDGTFQANIDFETGSSPMCVYAADLDGDGDMDLAVANKNDNSISVLMNINSTDTTPPSNVTNLSVSTVTATSATLTWNAPGDDSTSGTATTYDIRYSTSTITEANWASADTASGEPNPQIAGSAETFTVSGLSGNTTYYFAMKTADEVPNWSGLSNVVSGKTGTAVSGYQSGTWMLVNSPYIVLGDVTVGAGQTLTIEAGVEVRFAGNYGLKVSGSLFANGTATNHISFTSNQGTPAPGDWQNIYIGGTESRFDYCDFEYGGNPSAPQILYFFDAGSNQTFNHCKIFQSANDGVNVYFQSYPIFNYCEFSNNAGYGIYDGAGMKIRNCTIINNGNYGIRTFMVTNWQPSDFGTDFDPGMNAITNNTGYELWHGQTGDLPAKYNYWGTDDAVTIATYISGSVLYQPFIKYSETNTASIGSPISFNASGDGHGTEMNFTSITGSGNVTVHQINEAPANAPNINVSLFYLDIEYDETITAFEATLTFHYTDADVTGYTESSAYLGIAKYNSSTNTWQWLGGTVDAANNTVTVSGVTSFSTFALFRRIFGDITGDGYVDAADLQRLGDCWHETNSGEFTGGSDARFFNYNKNTDGGNQIIDAADLQVFGDCWHNGVQP